MFYSSKKTVVFLMLLALTLVVKEIEGAERLGLSQSIDLVLSQSDRALDLNDELVLSKMGIASAEHKFDTKLVPLTSVGFTEGTGSQQLGLEFRKETELGTSISYGAVGNRLDDNTGYVVENRTNASAYVRISQGLFRRWGLKYNLTELSTAELQDKEKQIQTERSRQNLILETVRSYYNLVLEGQLLDQSQQAKKRSQEHLNSAVSRQSVGLVSKVDVYRAELALLDSESAMENQLRLNRRAIASFKELLGFTEEEHITVPATIAKMSPVIPDEWQKNLLETRLDWQAHQVKVQINKLEISKVQRDLSPDIGLSFTVEQKGEGDSAEEALELDQTNWSVQLEMLSTLDNFHEESAMLRKKMEMAKLRRAEAALKRKINREAREAFQDLLTEERSHQISLKRLHQAEMALDLAKTRYEKGLSNNLDVLDAENAFSEAGINISQSLTAYNLAAVSIAYNLGVLDRNWIEVALGSPETLANNQ